MSATIIYFQPHHCIKRAGKALGKHKRSSSCNTVQSSTISTYEIDLGACKLLQAPASTSIVVNIKLSCEKSNEK